MLKARETMDWSALVSRAIMMGADWRKKRRSALRRWTGDRREEKHKKTDLDGMSEALLDGEGEDLDGDVLGLGMESGGKDPKEVALDDGCADAEGREEDKTLARQSHPLSRTRGKFEKSTHFDSA